MCLKQCFNYPFDDSDLFMKISLMLTYRVIPIESII